MMHVTRRRVLATGLAACLAIGVKAVAQTDPLPSWNEGPAKKAIVDFVAPAVPAAL